MSGWIQLVIVFAPWLVFGSFAGYMRDRESAWGDLVLVGGGFVWGIALLVLLANGVLDPGMVSGGP